MKVLIACEESQAVCMAFRNYGHEAFSCDIEPCSGPCPEFHIQDDIARVIYKSWDMILAFPPCTHLCVSGRSHFKHKRETGLQAQAVAFFMMFTAKWAPRQMIENPIGIMSTLYRKPDQIIQPYMFGHGETKATCLWLFGLPKLVHAEKNTLLYKKTWVEGREPKIHRMKKSPDRGKLRSKTYPGIANAMAEQWNF